MSQRLRSILVLARAGDPPLKEGRARLIWAANTANALSGLGYHSYLCGRGELHRSPLRWFSPLDVQEPDARFREFYNVRGSFRLAALGLPAFLRRKGDAYVESGDFETRYYYRRLVLPRFDLLHTRDWRVATMAVQQNIPTIYEDHHESFNEEQDHFDPAIVRHRAFRGAVAISDYVAETMLAKGMPETKLTMEDSGVSDASFVEVPASNKAAFREKWLANGRFEGLVAYTGGLHGIRGIDLLLDVAQRLPKLRFLVAGGRGRQVKEWNKVLKERSLKNVSLVGYLPQQELPAFLQSADVLAFPYQDRETSRITSPLKFYEYLCAGRPIAACKIPALERFAANPKIAAEWGEIGDLESFVRALEAALVRAQENPGLIPDNRTAAKPHSWSERQRRIVAHAGI